MDLKEMFLAKLEREAVVTRKAIERVPEGRNDWKPHEKSMEFGYLAVLVATMLSWISLMIERDELDLGDPSNGRLKAQNSGDPGGTVQCVGRGRRKGAQGSRIDDGRASTEDLAIQDRRPGGDRSASACDAVRLCIQPSGASSRAVDGVSAFERCQGTGDLWTICRRVPLIQIRDRKGYPDADSRYLSMSCRQQLFE